VEAFTAVGEAMAAVATDNQRSFRRGLAVTSCGPFFFSAEFAPARAGIAAEKAR
jgi:hypothetical protein